ncbi:MAG: hypothetical protein ACOX6T_02915 [Myxococcales bacterium]|jgi:hypothetical protein
MAFDLQEALKRSPAEFRFKAPDKPIVVALVEARTLFDKTASRRDALAQLPDFQLDNYDAIPILCEALYEQEHKWQAMRNRSVAGPARAEAESFRSYFLSAAEYLLRKDKDAVAALGRIKEGDGVDDLVIDLHDIGALASKPEYAAKLALDSKLPQDIPGHAKALADKMIKAKDNSESLEAIAMRNQLFWLLDEVVEEVRAGARFLLRDEPRLLVEISSRYEARRKRLSRAKAKDAQSEPTQS